MYALPPLGAPAMWIEHVNELAMVRSTAERLVRHANATTQPDDQERFLLHAMHRHELAADAHMTLTSAHRKLRSEATGRLIRRLMWGVAP